MPENTVKVDRSTMLGNPFVCHFAGGPGSWCTRQDDEATYCCLTTFREYMVSGIEGRPSVTGSVMAGLDGMQGYPRRAKMVAALGKVRGKNLACWCALDRPCHADVLLELANADSPTQHGYEAALSGEVSSKARASQPAATMGGE